MDDKRIDEILAQPAPQVDPALLGRISSSLGASLRPVRPLAPSWMLALGLVLATAAVASFCAFLLGLHGVHIMTAADIGFVFPALGIFTVLAALFSVSTMTPGGMRWRMAAHPIAILLIVLVGWTFLAGFVFRDYAMGSFLAQGVPCLRAGLIVAIPAGIVSWLILRRGFAVNPATAGFTAGTLAGLAGLAMLELHCPIHLAPHIMVWHTAVVPIAALVGAILARYARSRQRSVLE